MCFFLQIRYYKQTNSAERKRHDFFSVYTEERGRKMENRKRKRALCSLSCFEIYNGNRLLGVLARHLMATETQCRRDTNKQNSIWALSVLFIKAPLRWYSNTCHFIISKRSIYMQRKPVWQWSEAGCCWYLRRWHQSWHLCRTFQHPIHEWNQRHHTTQWLWRRHVQPLEMRTI